MKRIRQYVLVVFLSVLITVVSGFVRSICGQNDPDSQDTAQTIVKSLNENLEAKEVLADKPASPSSQRKKSSANDAERKSDKELRTLKVVKDEGDLFKMELRNVEIKDLVRVLAQEHDLNIIMDKEVSGTVTASFSNITLEEALRGLLQNLNLIAEKDGNLIKIKKNLVSKLFVLKYVEANTVYTTLSGEQKKEGKVSKKGALVDLLSEDGKVFLGKSPNSLLVIDYPVNIERIEEYMDSVDRKMETRVFKLKYLNSVDIIAREEKKGNK